MTKDAYKQGEKDEDLFVLVAGDRDYVPTLLELAENGFKVEVVFWGALCARASRRGVKFHQPRPASRKPSLLVRADDYCLT
ncbi:NYN domain-containing protein [Bradyrhizobium sp. Arg237L]|uniref:NYN domain-containing protein n=1 Tax=Bradyrhizobium sp. Arg237L TaxID=3003352 RepID=UPI00249E426F|nr:NYN domain-containing protein [Bradyrhizobium sp. Arg237L]MDI4232759.1 NYN domain-containing protein [Bradyrhizobium sp. Arg237L]